MRILIVEDDRALRQTLKDGLTEVGYHVTSAHTVRKARALSEGQPFDLVLLDLGLPDGDGVDYLQELRVHNDCPVLIITARDTLSDKVRGFEAGGDDYLVKPFDFQELIARMRALLRRVAPPPAQNLTVADLTIDLLHREVTRSGVRIECTPREFDVLTLLALTPGKVVSRDALTLQVWKVHSKAVSMNNVIDVLMFRLRDKVDGQHERKLIHTVRGLGFMLKGDP